MDLATALAELVGTALQAKDFIIAEMPDVIRQLLMWKMWESLIYTLLSGSVLLWFTICTFRFCKKHSEKISHKYEHTEYTLGAFIAVMITIVSLVVFLSSDLDWLQILIAPKVYLIEYAATLVK